MYIYVLWLVKSLLMFISVCVYVSIVYMLCCPMLEEIKNLSIYMYYRIDDNTLIFVVVVFNIYQKQRLRSM